MRTLVHILLILFSLSGFSQVGEEKFTVKKKKEPSLAQPVMHIERTWANISFKAVNDSAQLIWWKTELDGDDTISLKKLRLGYSLSLKYGDYGTQITSFVMDFIDGDKIKKLSSGRSYVTQAMAMELSNLKPGSIIIMRDIVYNRWERIYSERSPGQAAIEYEKGPTEVKRTGPYRIFVTE